MPFEIPKIKRGNSTVSNEIFRTRILIDDTARHRSPPLAAIAPHNTTTIAANRAVIRTTSAVRPASNWSRVEVVQITAKVEVVVEVVQITAPSAAIEVVLCGAMAARGGRRWRAVSSMTVLFPRDFLKFWNVSELCCYYLI